MKRMRFMLPVSVPFDYQYRSDNLSHVLSTAVHKFPQAKTYSHVAAAIERSIETISGFSRTFQGTSNTDVSADKEPLLLSGDALVARVKVNFRQVASSVAVTESRPFHHESDAELYLLNLAFHISEGLLPVTRPIFRTWRTSIPAHCPPERIAQEFALFATEFRDWWPNSFSDPVAFCAWLEQRSNAQGHFLTDGCGRFARSISSGALARHGLAYPRFNDRIEYFNLIEKPLPAWTVEYRARVICNCTCVNEEPLSGSASGQPM